MPTLARRSPAAALLCAAAAALLPLSGCDTFSGPRHEQTRAMLVPHIAATPLSVVNANGSVEALSRDREDVSIEITLYGPDLERLGFANIHADRMGDDTLRVWVEWPGGERRNSEGAAISINTPGAEDVSVRTSNGRVVVEGLSGHADLESTNGSVRADSHDGSLYARTTNGSIQAEHISGPVEMYSTNGRILVTDAFGPIRAETTNANAYISTMDGNQGPVRVRTTNGRIDLDLGDGFVGVLRADTTNGRILVTDLDDARLIESAPTSAVLRVGQGSEEVSAARTTNGSIRIRGHEPSR